MMDTILRSAMLRENSFDPETREFDCVAATDAPIWNARSGFEEVLSCNGDAVEAHLPISLLDSHNRESVANIVGVVFGIRAEGGKIIARGRVDNEPNLVRKFTDRIITQVSCCAVPRSWKTITNGGRPRRVAERWELKEISLVASGADPNARIRSEDMEAAERQAAVESIARACNFDAEWITRQMESEDDLAVIREHAIEALQTRSIETRRIRSTTTRDEPADVLRSMGDALYARVSGSTPSEPARRFMGHTLRDVMRECLTARGISTRNLVGDELIRAALHTTSDFPILLTGTGERVMMASYQAAESPIVALTKRSTLNDFRQAHRVRLSGIGKLERVPESGEITHTTREEGAEAIKIDTFAKLFGLTRQALVNDDLGAFTDWATAAGRSAAETIAQGLTDLLMSNPIMSDGFALFSTQHNNLSLTPDNPSGTDYDLAPISEARLALRNMKGLAGEPINARGKFLLVGADLEVEAEKILADITAATPADANTTKLTLLVESRLPPLAWYVFADPAVLPVLEQATLSSAPGPQMASREGWNILGVEFRVVLDWGAAAIDFRGAFKNAGAP